MKSSENEEPYVAPNSIGCEQSWSMLPLSIELQKSANWQLTQRTQQLAISELLTNRSVRYAMCSVDRVFKNPDFDLALPIGEVIHGPCGLVYFAGDRVDELKSVTRQRKLLLRDIFLKAQITRRTDIRQVAQFISESVASLDEPDLPQAPFVRFEVGCGLFSSLAKLMYRFLFGIQAFKTNQVLQTGGQNFKSVSDLSLQFIQGNDALTRRPTYRHTIDLIELWNELTGLPFVSSIIQSRDRQALPQLRSQIIATAELTQAKMRVDPAEYLPNIRPINCNGLNIDLASLWKQVSYRLNSEDYKSLLLFLNLSMPIVSNQPLKESSFRIKLLRWQERNAQLLN